MSVHAAPWLEAALGRRGHALAGVDLTPGLASEASCPEAIWQAAKW